MPLYCSPQINGAFVPLCYPIQYICISRAFRHAVLLLCVNISRLTRELVLFRRTIFLSILSKQLITSLFSLKTDFKYIDLKLSLCHILSHISIQHITIISIVYKICSVSSLQFILICPASLFYST